MIRQYFPQCSGVDVWVAVKRPNARECQRGEYKVRILGSSSSYSRACLPFNELIESGGGGVGRRMIHRRHVHVGCCFLMLLARCMSVAVKELECYEEILVEHVLYCSRYDTIRRSRSDRRTSP